MEEQILVIGPSWIGDMVMAQALFKALKRDNSRIDVLAPPWCLALTERMPEVTTSIAMPLGHGQLKLAVRYQLAQQLKKHRYQRCYVLPNSFKSALIPFWAKIPKRIGWRGEGRYFLLNQMRYLDKQRYPLMVQRYLALADETAYFTPQLVTQKHHVQQALQQCQLTLPTSPLLILCPGAEFGPAKRWPATSYAALANHYLADNHSVWIMGSSKDQEIAKTIHALAPGIIDLTNQTTLAQAIDLMSLANLVVTNDTGLMHIAAALNRPLVAIFGASDPHFTPPLAQNVQIVKENLACQPCFQRTCPLVHHHCMHQLSVQKVIEAIQVLENT